jgi:peptide/nickel transport system substrate-binding protein
MPRSRVWSALALILTLGMGLAACSQPTGTSSSGDTGGGGGGGGTVKEGGTAQVALAEAPDALDPTVAGTYVGRIVFANMCEKLYDVGQGLQLVPQLAAAMPQITNGGKTYTIPLREGVRFNDGTKFDAAAVKTTLEHYLTDPLSSRASELVAVKSIEVVDPMTVRLQLSEPFSPLTSILADRSGMMLSPTQLDKLGDKFARDPVCVGAFAFQDRPSPDDIELTKSKYYYDKENVHLDGIDFSVVTENNVRAANLRSGDIDVADRIAPPDMATLKAESGVELRPVTSLGYQGITINVSNSNGAGKPGQIVDNPLAQHPELRQAFDLSLDRDVINKVVFQGQYVPACTPISPVNPLAPDIPCPSRDIAKAKQLVAQSGVPTPIPVTLVVEAANSEATRLGTVIQSMAKEAGFDVNLKATEFTTALEQAEAGNFETFQVGWSGRLDPDQNIAPSWDPNSTLNYSGADYADVEQLMAQERATTDPAQRQQIFQQMSQAFLEHDNIIYLYYPKVVLGYTSSLTGIKYGADGLIHLEHAGFTGG